MDFLKHHWFHIFGLAIIFGGIYGLVRGQLTVGAEGTDKLNRTLTGKAARVLSFGYLGAGSAFFFSVALGMGMTFAVIALTWILGDPSDEAQ